MPKMTATRKRLMVKIKDFPEDVITQFMAKSRNWKNRDAERLRYIEHVEAYQRSLENYYGELWPAVLNQRYNNVTLYERMFAKPPQTFELRQNFYERISSPEYVEGRENRWRGNYIAALIKTGRAELAERVYKLNRRQWVAFSLDAPPIEFLYFDDGLEKSDTVAQDVERLLRDVERKYQDEK